MSNVFCLLYGRQFVEFFLPIDAITSEGIDSQVAYAKRGKVLEEVRTLAWVNLEAVQTCLHNDLSGADMTPFHGNSQPRVAASPSARTDEEVGRVGILQELPVDFLNLFGNRRIV